MDFIETLVVELHVLAVEVFKLAFSSLIAEVEFGLLQELLLHLLHFDDPVLFVLFFVVVGEVTQQLFVLGDTIEVLEEYDLCYHQPQTLKLLTLFIFDFLGSKIVPAFT